MANDNTVESQVWPVNELGELILTQGSGSTNVVGFVPSVSLPSDPRTNRVKAVFGASSAETATVAEPLTYYLKEGSTVKFTSNAATGTITKYKADGSVDFTQSVASGATYTYGPYSGTQKFIITPATGSIDATVANAVLAVPVSGGGSINPGDWVSVPSLFRLRLTGTGTLSLDARDRLGNVTTAVHTATATNATNQIEFPYIGDAANQIRANVTGSLTIEVL